MTDDNKKFSKMDFSILLGNAIDHFCISLYAFVAPLLAQDFFPEYDPVMALILTYSICATSIITRPLGAFLFGYLAIKKGPISGGLNISLIGVGVMTILIGLIPPYAYLGIMAPVLLVTARMIRGVFAAGESAIAKLYVIENKPNKLGFEASYYYQFSSMVGTIAASFCASIIFVFNLPSDFWRIFFIFSGGLLVIARSGALLRGESRSGDETIPCGLEKYNFRELLEGETLLTMLKVLLTTGISHITYLIPFILLNNLIPQISEVKMSEMMTFNTLLLILDLLMISIFGRFLKNYEPEKIMIYCLFCMLVSIPVMLNFLESASSLYIIFVRIWIVFLGVIFMCPQHLYYNIIANRIGAKYLVVGMGNAIGAATIGRFSTPFALYLFYISRNMAYISLYFGLIMLMTIFILIKK